MTDADEPTYTLSHDSSNALILPSSGKKKNPTFAEEKKRSAGKQKPRLSNKKLKHLKKVLERKQKRFSRIEVLEKLSKNRIGQDEINLLTSVAHMQDKAKRKFVDVDSNDPVVLTTNSISGSKRKKYLVARDSVVANRHSSTGPYFETDSSSSEDNDLESTFKEDETIGPIKSTESNNEDVRKSVLVLDHKETDVARNEICKNNIKQKPLCAEDDKLKEKPVAKRQPVVHVPLQRTVEIQECRLKLPILGMEQEIMETINDASVVVVCGETGSGKTTQVPQFLYEAGYCSNGMLVGITEPRRVAAMSMSRRVAEEMNLPTSVVSYQIRYEGNVTKDTKIKFLTDGVLLKEIKNDFLLKAYSVVIIDEAHERSMYSDILIGLLSRIVLLREKRQDGMVPPLKLIIMSATLRVDDFLSPKLFKNRPPSVMNVESRQYPVTVHFNKRTEQNFLKDAYKKCCKIHRTLPEGGILVFVSGQREVHTLVTWLTSTFPMKLLRKNNDELAGGDNFGAKRQRRGRRTLPPKPTVSLDSYRIEDFDINETDAADYEIFDEEMDEEFLDAIYDNSFDQPLYCLPMYSLLSAKKQAQVFEPVPSGCRLCVVATNVAETSLTIPNVKYVVDTGKEKVRSYDGVTGVSKFMVQWISKASAEQRTGRAGRVCPGQCYRLYSSAVFSEFQQFSTPEIVDKPIDELVLTMKNMNILKVCNFPFPTSPDENVLRAAEERLVKLDALQRRKSEDHAKITDLGRTMALFPVLPAYGKIICLAHQHKLLSYIIRLVAALSVREPLINLTSLTLNSDKKHANSDDANVVENEDDKKLNDKILEQLKIRREWSSTGEYYLFGDFQVLLRAVLEAERNGFDEKFCAKNGLRQKAMLEISKMCKQLRKITKSVFPDSEFYEDTTFGPLPTPSQDQTFIMRRIFAAGLLDNFSVKHPDAISGSREEKRRLKNAYQCANKMKDPVFIHPTSVLRRKHPDYVLYHDIVDSAKKYMSTVMAVSRDWIDPNVLADVTFQ